MIWCSISLPSPWLDSFSKDGWYLSYFHWFAKIEGDGGERLLLGGAQCLEITIGALVRPKFLFSDAWHWHRDGHKGLAVRASRVSWARKYNINGREIPSEMQEKYHQPELHIGRATEVLLTWWMIQDEWIAVKRNVKTKLFLFSDTGVFIWTPLMSPFSLLCTIVDFSSHLRMFVFQYIAFDANRGILAQR